MELTKKVAYLQGLIEGLAIDETSNEGRIIRVMADILEDMADTIEIVADEANETADLVDAINEDLNSLEDEIYGEDEDCDCDCCCDDDDDDFDFDDEQMFECVCPNCGDNICLGENVVAEGSIECPNCGETLEFDFSEIEDEEE